MWPYDDYPTLAICRDVEADRSARAGPIRHDDSFCTDCAHDHGASGKFSLPTGVAHRPFPPSFSGELSVAASSWIR